LMREALHPESRSTGVMWAPRPSGCRPYAILVAPLAQELDLMAVARPAICVVVTDPERLPVPEEAMLRKLFGFTKAEARLAARLAHGQALNEAAMALSIAYGTARTHLAAIFRKTGTNRQGELVRLLAADLPSFVL